MPSSVRERLNADIKSAMRARESERLTVLRNVSAAIKQREVDERIELDDTAVVAVIEKLIKQRRDSAEQFKAGGRPELADQEEREMEWLSAYMPEALDANAVAAMIRNAITEAGAESMRDMGKVIGLLKPQLAGRADMGAVSKQVRDQLNS